MSWAIHITIQIRTHNYAINLSLGLAVNPLLMIQVVIQDWQMHFIIQQNCSKSVPADGFSLTDFIPPRRFRHFFYGKTA